MKSRLNELDAKIRETEGQCFKMNNTMSAATPPTIMTSSGISTSSSTNPISSLLITPSIRKSHMIIESECCSTSLMDEPSKMRELLARNFEERYQNLERSKQQTRNVIESLELNLNDIELMTANNIFKITTSLS